MTYVKKKNMNTANKQYMTALIIKCEAKRLSIRMLKDFHRLNKLNKCRPFPDRMDPAIISMEIKDDTNQTLESLAVRLGSMYLWSYDDILAYLQDNIDKLYYNYAEPGMRHEYRKIRWSPGTDNDVYNLFMLL